MGQSRGAHVPVLLARCGQLLAPAFLAALAAGRRPVHVDATIGLGGHAEAMLTDHPELTLVGLDRDPDALAHARERLSAHAPRVRLVHAVYDQLTEVLAGLGHDQVDGVLFDLGVSSLQLDAVDRGFAYAQDAPLDMRMDPGSPLTAETVVNTYPASELTRVLRDYGEERFAARIAGAIVRERERERLASTGRLAELVRAAIPAATRRTGGHPAKRTFQAIRIEVNGELAALAAALPAALDALLPGGRIVVLSYHSLEDRMTKKAFAALATDTTPADLPVPLPDRQPELRLLTRGAELPTDEENERNPRAQSARLRAAERVRPARQ
jgi:16S rRNA (cytosine1402-N4)-methyltransferase